MKTAGAMFFYRAVVHFHTATDVEYIDVLHGSDALGYDMDDDVGEHGPLHDHVMASIRKQTATIGKGLEGQYFIVMVSGKIQFHTAYNPDPDYYVEYEPILTSIRSPSTADMGVINSMCDVEQSDV